MVLKRFVRPKLDKSYIPNVKSPMKHLGKSAMKNEAPSGLIVFISFTTFSRFSILTYLDVQFFNLLVHITKLFVTSDVFCLPYTHHDFKNWSANETHNRGPLGPRWVRQSYISSPLGESKTMNCFHFARNRVRKMLSPGDFFMFFWPTWMPFCQGLTINMAWDAPHPRNSCKWRFMRIQY